MANNYFQFKQFKVIQEKSAMKVGTDGILLGAWANVENAKNILDIGAGTGLITLMLAQRSNAKISGIEIEPEAAREASQNVANSNWHKRISIQNIAFQKFQRECTQKFDLVVSNPPFFINSLKSATIGKTLARHNDGLSFLELISGASNLLSEKGKMAIVIPSSVYEEVLELATKNGLFISRKTEVKSGANKKTHRCLLEFSKIETSTIFDDLAIYKIEGSAYSDEFKELTKAYYLNF